MFLEVRLKCGSILSCKKGGLGLVPFLLGIGLATLGRVLHDLILFGSSCRLGQSKSGFFILALGVMSSGRGFVTCLFGTNSDCVGFLSASTCCGCFTFRGNAFIKGSLIVTLSRLFSENRVLSGNEGSIASILGRLLIIGGLIHLRDRTLHLEMSLTLST